MLSVPGKEDAVSVYSMMRERYPEADGPLIVHRLDMATSGLLVIAKTKQCPPKPASAVQEPPVSGKRYIALLQGSVVSKDTGTVELPLMPEPARPPTANGTYRTWQARRNRLMKYWNVKDGNRTRIAFYPRTGRTHQLRVHAAHPLGLHCPIIGDELYGRESRTPVSARRNAWSLPHPVTGKRISITQKADF